MTPLFGSPNSLPARMVRAALGDPRLYEELARNPSAIRQAIFVVLLVSVVHGLGTALASLFGVSDESSVRLFFNAGLFTLFGWTLTAVFTYMIVSLIAGTSAAGFLGGTFLQFVRSAGFTATPGLLLILIPIPVIGAAAFLASTIWMTTALIIATRETLGCNMILAVIAVIAGTLIGRVIIFIALSFVLG